MKIVFLPDISAEPDKPASCTGNHPDNSMNTIVELIDRAYTNWNIAERVGAIGIELESRSRLPLARKMLARAIELKPTGSAEWYAVLAFASFRDTANLAEDGERALIDGIETMDSDVLKAWHAAFVEEEDIAQQIFEIVRDSDDISVQFTYGHALLWRGHNDEALSVLRRTIRRVPAETLPAGIDLYCGGLNWMRAQGADIDVETEVKPYIERCVVAYPDVYQYRSLLLQMYQVTQQWEQVCNTALATLAVFPDEETTMLALGSACEKLGDDEQAAMWYSRAIGAKPSYARARVHLGKLYERLGRAELAEIVFRELPVSNPTYHMGKIALACYLHRAGSSKEARGIFAGAYDRLKPHEKGALAANPDAAALLQQINEAVTA